MKRDDEMRTCGKRQNQKARKANGRKRVKARECMNDRPEMGGT
jgi:hypothetical protein